MMHSNVLPPNTSKKLDVFRKLCFILVIENTWQALARTIFSCVGKFQYYSYLCVVGAIFLNWPQSSIDFTDLRVGFALGGLHIWFAQTHACIRPVILRTRINNRTRISSHNILQRWEVSISILLLCFGDSFLNWARLHGPQGWFWVGGGATFGSTKLMQSSAVSDGSDVTRAPYWFPCYCLPCSDPYPFHWVPSCDRLRTPAYIYILQGFLPILTPFLNSHHSCVRWDFLFWSLFVHKPQGLGLRGAGICLKC